MLEPVAVTKDNVKSTVVADGFVTASELCTSAYASACKEAGISAAEMASTALHSSSWRE